MEQDPAPPRAAAGQVAGEAAAQGTPTPTSMFTLDDGGGNIHTAAQITGKAASMGEGMVSTVLDALITDFTQKFAAAV